MTYTKLLALALVTKQPAKPMPLKHFYQLKDTTYVVHDPNMPSQSIESTKKLRHCNTINKKKYYLLLITNPKSWAPYLNGSSLLLKSPRKFLVYTMLLIIK